MVVVELESGYDRHTWSMRVAELLAVLVGQETIWVLRLNFSVIEVRIGSEAVVNRSTLKSPSRINLLIFDGGSSSSTDSSSPRTDSSEEEEVGL